MLRAILAACFAENGPASASGSASSSFGQILIKALPSEVQQSSECVAQLENSERSAAPGSQAVTALDAFQTEKSHVHGTLVSYLHSGWHSQSMHKTSATESDRGSSGSALSASEIAEGHVSRSSDPKPASKPGSTGQQQGRVFTEQQQQESSTALGMPASQQSPRRTERNNAVSLEPNSGSLTGTLSRRQEAMALLESRHHKASPG